MSFAALGTPGTVVDHYPDSLVCPILGTLMADPVIAPDGHSYEKSAISEWFKNSNVSPMTGLPLDSKILISNHALRKTIDDFCQGRPDRAESREESRKPQFVSSTIASRQVTPETAAPWEFDKRLLARTLPHDKRPVILCTSRTSLNTGEGVLLGFEPQVDGKEFRLVLSHPLKIEKRFGTDASISCIEHISDRAFVAGTRDGGVGVWELQRNPSSGQITAKRTWCADQNLHTSETSCVTPVPTFSLLSTTSESSEYSVVASGSQDGGINLWSKDPKSQQWSHRASMEHRGGVRCLSASNEGHVLSGGDDWSLKMWDSNNPSEPVRTLDGHSHTVRCITAERTTRGRFASGSNDENVIVWDIRQPEPLVHKIEAGSPVLTICWGDGFLCAGGGTAPDSMSGSSGEYMGGWVRFWDPRTWRMLSDATIPTTGPKVSSSTKLSLTAEKYLRPRTAHEVSTFALNPFMIAGNKAVVSGGDDRMLRVWLSPTFSEDPFFPKPFLAYELGGDSVIPISVDAVETFYL